MKTDDLRESYLAFFESKGCVRRPSDVLVPRWDPSVLFTPAGMNQFKDHFLGRCKLEFTRATSCQKCLRTGDIDNVGRTAYHHTFFEMLGNFSFGDYFKRDAIHWAWEFLTSKKWLGLDPARLSVSVYVDDDEAAEIWANEIKLSPDRIARMGEDDNFWPAGAPSSGPDGVCGPCSEIFYHTPEGGEVEIWNLVFTQFNRVGDPPDNLRPLPSKNIDTGMGLERTAATLQGVDSNFHIDILLPIVEAAGEICGMKYDRQSENGRRMRRIADHVRACTFAIHENVYPGPNKEKYVIKRLLRRAVLDGRQMGATGPFLHRLVPVVVECMKQPYPELSDTIRRVSQVIQQEETNFFGTIDAGLDRIKRLFETTSKEGRMMVAGGEAAELYTTHGFPPELLESMAAEHNLTFDWADFRREMEQHGVDSGAGQKMELFTRSPMDALKKAMHGTEFLGYEKAESECTVVGIIASGKLCDELDEIGHDNPVALVLDRTPFYGESGGQVGDTGEITGDVFRFKVTDTQKDGEFILHLGHLREGRLEQGRPCTARIDAKRRAGIRRAHSATHILHYALQKHLGEHAQQQGSKVDRDWLRFDFTHPSPVKPNELAQIEEEINERVLSAEAVSWNRLPIADARRVGAMMLFGEKYPDIVRVVSIGGFSKELCGGTHVQNTGQVGLVKLIGEESVSAGTRRITAITGRGILDRLNNREQLLEEAAKALKAPLDELPRRIDAQAKRVKELEKTLARAKQTRTVNADELLNAARDFGGIRVIAADVGEVSVDEMRGMIDQLRQKSAPIAVLLGSRQADDKVILVAGISRDLEKRGLDAGNWVRVAAKEIDGSGGGRKDMAQAGGKRPENLPAALSVAIDALEQQLTASATGN